MIGSRKDPYQIVLGEEVTGVDSIFAAEQAKQIHRMDGAVISDKNIEDLPKGIYIIGGKKVVK